MVKVINKNVYFNLKEKLEFNKVSTRHSKRELWAGILYWESKPYANYIQRGKEIKTYLKGMEAY